MKENASDEEKLEAASRALGATEHVIDHESNDDVKIIEGGLTDATGTVALGGSSDIGGTGESAASADIGASTGAAGLATDNQVLTGDIRSGD
jgi:hypothetical protein